MDQTTWVDFRTVKAAVSFPMVLGHYGVNWLRQSGEELRGRCPIHKGDGDRTFHVNLAKNAFNCFSCKAKGNVLEFVAAMERCSIRDAAVNLQGWFNLQEADTSKRHTPHQPPLPPQSASVINPVLGFELKVDGTHEYGAKRGLSNETLKCFGAGYCLSKGTFAGRFVIPLHDPQGQLVGYAGRSLDDAEPKYLFPSSEKGFHKRYLLFNWHRALKAEHDGRVIVVEGFFDCMKLHQAGFRNTVALMGSSLSDAQETLLTNNFYEVILLLDGDAAGQTAATLIAGQLARTAWVRIIVLTAGKQPDQLEAEDLQRLLGAV